MPLAPLNVDCSNWNVRNNASHCCQFGLEELQLLQHPSLLHSLPAITQLIPLFTTLIFFS
jgi:hypothetical protein